MSDGEKIWKAEDGAVDEEKYYKETQKILWILKEPNGSDFNFKQYMKDPRVYNKWKQSYGLVVKTSNVILNNIKGINRFSYPSNIPKIMSRIALINVKKTGGIARAEACKIHEYVAKNPHELQKQIEELSPDILILAGTAEFISSELLFNIKKYTGRDTVVIKTYHPGQSTIKHSEYINNVISLIDNYY